jgi:hypothetical protein
MPHLPYAALRLGAFCLLAWSSFSSRALDAADTQPLSTQWKAMLDEKLSQWEVFMGVPHPSVSGLPPGTHQAKGNEGAPLGLNNDPKQVFTVQMVAGEPVLHITGEIFGCVSSLASYENFHFRAQFRWGEQKWEPRLKKARDSGILYHCTGPHGAFWNVWKSCIEFQVCEGEFGKLYPLAGTSAQIAEVFKDAFQKDHRTPGYQEKPTGEWNDLEIYVVNDRSVHLLNGTVVNALSGLAKKENEKLVPLTAGQIQLQSEAAECDYRRVEIRSITVMPDAYNSYWTNDPSKKP